MDNTLITKLGGKTRQRTIPGNSLDKIKKGNEFPCVRSLTATAPE